MHCGRLGDEPHGLGDTRSKLDDDGPGQSVDMHDFARGMLDGDECGLGVDMMRLGRQRHGHAQRRSPHAARWRAPSGSTCWLLLLHMVVATGMLLVCMAVFARVPFVMLELLLLDMAAAWRPTLHEPRFSWWLARPFPFRAECAHARRNRAQSCRGRRRRPFPFPWLALGLDSQITAAGADHFLSRAQRRALC